MTPPSEESSRPAAAARERELRAALVLARDGVETRYDMLEVQTLSPQGAVLACGLLLEMDEEVDLDLALGDGGLLRARGRVVRLVYELPGVEVAFTGLDQRDRKRIENRTAAAAET